MRHIQSFFFSLATDQIWNTVSDKSLLKIPHSVACFFTVGQSLLEVYLCVHGDCHLFHNDGIISRACVLYLPIKFLQIHFSFQIKGELKTRSFVCICGMKASAELCVLISALYIWHDLFI